MYVHIMLAIATLMIPSLAQATAGFCVVGTNAGERLEDRNNLGCIIGNGGNDSMFGLDGGDQLEGAEVNGAYSSNSGADQMFGGAGSDRFIVGPHKLLSAPAGVDRIRDFQAGETICTPIAISGWRKRPVGTQTQIVVRTSSGERVIALVDNMGSKSATVRSC
jgi:RTX calcium-binding nonapeptide repeat (4 copies)